MASTQVIPTKLGTRDTLQVAGDVRLVNLGEEPASTVTEDAEVVPPVPASIVGTAQNTKPIQIWEGVVIDVNAKNSTISAKLRAKVGQLPEHTAVFNFEWIPDQDMDLVVPGAVFYLTLFKKRNRGSIENNQELRFRRVPSWSNEQVRRVYEAADELGKRMRIGTRLADD